MFHVEQKRKAEVMEGRKGFLQFFWRVSACHMTSYFSFGLLAFWLFDYRGLYQTPDLEHFMVSTDSPQVALGPALQLFRGLLFSLVLWPIRDAFLGRERGWLYLWLLFLGLVVLGTAGPSPGSLEGVIYTQVPMRIHLIGLPEVVLQTLLFSLMLVFWYQYPGRWWNWIMAFLIALIILLGVSGWMAAMSLIQVPD